MARKISIIRKKRREMDLTQSELAHLVGSSRASVNSWESKLTIPTVHFMIQLSVHLELSLDELMNDYKKEEE